MVIPKAESEGSQSHRFGAPYPEHKGLPSIHLEKLACTACHSGPLPNEELTQVRTSRANRLGIHGKAQWDTDLPQIIEPVFASQDGGKIAPHRLMWPAFWAKFGRRESHPPSTDSGC